MSFDLNDKEVYKYLGFAFAIFIIIFFIYQTVKTQTRIVESMSNPDSKPVGEILDKLKKEAKTKRDDLHVTEDREKYEDIIISLKSLIGTGVMKDISTKEDIVENPMNVAMSLALYNQAMEGFDKLIKQLDRFENKVKKEKSSWG